MKLIHKIYDHRINALNVLLEASLGEYDELSNTILKANPLQRNRVKTAGTVYSLLKTDLKEGIVIPPIVLGLNLDIRAKEKTDTELLSIIDASKQKLIILDGLQRTYTIKDLLKELSDKRDPEVDKTKLHPIRVEIYLGINKLGILYRMLTLNTGQTPMSSRHQIEIIYSDYIEGGIEGVKLIKQTENQVPNKVKEYNFKDIIDGFTSYLERDYLTFERTDILDNIKSLEKLAIENQDKDLFVQFVKAYNLLSLTLTQMSDSWNYDPEETTKKLGGAPFARNAINIFNKSQVMTGFGSAIGKLIDLEELKDFSDAQDLIPKIKSKNISSDLYNPIGRLDDLRLVAVKIGNDQRIFFHYLFREIFDRRSDGYLNFGESVNQAYQQYLRRTK